LRGGAGVRRVYTEDGGGEGLLGATADVSFRFG
jgi:hypothetical protein